jgi:hypothetical protein
VAARFKARIVFALSDNGIVGSNLTQSMDVCVCVCVCFYSVFVLSCVLVAALRQAGHSSKESYRLCEKKYYATEEERPHPTNGCRLIDE